MGQIENNDVKAVKRRRKKYFKETILAFEEKFSWLGHQAARELLMSAASWNIEEYSDPPFRYRTHVMLAWRRGWFKSTILKRMASIIGDENHSVCGKVTDAAIRGSMSGQTFTPPKVLKAPILVSTEYGQTNFEEELLNTFLALLEEGETNISMNKIGALTDKGRDKAESDYKGRVEFKDENEFDLKANFVFWGGTYDPSKLQDDALRSRFNIVTPAKSLDYQITYCADRNKFYLDPQVAKGIRQELRRDMPMETDFTPPKSLYKKYNLEPRESAPLQSYMACRNWWGLPTDPDIMENFLKNLKKSRRLAKMSPSDRVFDLIFDNPMSYDELEQKTGYDTKEIYTHLENIPNATRIPSSMTESGEVKWVVYSKGEDEVRDSLREKFGKNS